MRLTLTIDMKRRSRMSAAAYLEIMTEAYRSKVTVARKALGFTVQKRPISRALESRSESIGAAVVRLRPDVEKWRE